MKYILIAIALLASNCLVARDKNPLPEKPKIEKPSKPKHFPKHWGRPPQIQLKDYVTLPNGFGKGSSTLANWIKENLKKDAENKKPETKPKPEIKPKPKPNKPSRPNPRPEPPKEVKDKMGAYKEAQKTLQEGLKKRLKDLGEKPSREAVRKEVERFKAENKAAIDSQKSLGKDIQDWHKDNRPERPKRPEPSEDVKNKMNALKEQQEAFKGVRDAFRQAMERSKDMSKEDRDELIKEFKEASVENHRAIKEAHKALQKQIRETRQDGQRRK